MADKRLQLLMVELHRQWHKNNRAYREFEKLRHTATEAHDVRSAEDGMLVSLAAMNAINAALQDAGEDVFKESEGE